MPLTLKTPSGYSAAHGRKSWPLAGSGVIPRGYSAPQQDIRLLGGDIQTFQELYWSQPWVQAVVNKLARGIARLPLKTYQYVAPDSDPTNLGLYPQEQPQSVIAQMLRAPYPTAGMFQLIEFIVGSLCIYGNATLVKFRGGRGQTPAEIWPMPFDRVSILQGDDQPIDAYIWGGFNTIGSVGQQRVFLPEDVIHFKWFNPVGWQSYGRSPLEALATTMALEEAGQRYALSSFGNGARPASFVVSDKKLSKEQRDQLRAELDAAYVGPDNAFKIALLDNGLDWKPIGMNMQETGLTENRKISREEVCAVYDVPPPMVGILDQATYSNIDEQHTMLYQTTFAPICTMIEQIFNAQMVDTEPAWKGSFTHFDMGEITRGNDLDRATAYQKFLQSGVRTPNELRILEGLMPKGKLDDAENPANAIYVQVNMQPMGDEGMLKPLASETIRDTIDEPPIGSTAADLLPTAGAPVPAPAPAPDAQAVSAAKAMEALGAAMEVQAGLLERLMQKSVTDGLLMKSELADTVDELRRTAESMRPFEAIVRIEEGAVRVEAPAPAQVDVKAELHQGSGRSVKKIEFSDGRTATITEEELSDD